MPNYRIKVLLKDGTIREGSSDSLLWDMGLKESHFWTKSIGWDELQRTKYAAILLKENFPEVKEVRILDPDGKEL